MPELEALKVLAEVAEERNLHVLLIGAMARQLIFDERRGGRPYRATLDIDAAVRVGNWPEFDGLVNALIEGAGFTRQSDHRFRFRDRTEVDLLPFGGVADAAGNVTWQGGDRTMSLEGFEVADANSEEIELGAVTVRVASLPSLVALKHYAFRDRFERTANDLSDLVHIFENATEMLRQRAYQELGGELVALEYPQVGPYLLGSDIVRITPAAELTELRTIVEGRILDAPVYLALNRVSRGRGVAEKVTLFEAFLEALKKPSAQHSPGG